MELIDQVIRQGRQAIVLIPEIALTYQTVRRFYGRFGDKVSVINSRLSQGERYDQVQKSKAGGTPGKGRVPVLHFLPPLGT